MIRTVMSRMRSAGPLIVLTLAVLLANGCRETERAAPDPAEPQPRTDRETILWLPSGDRLISVKRTIAQPEDRSAALAPILDALRTAGPASDPALPEDAVVRGAWILADGTAVIDLGGPTLQNGWGIGSAFEILSVYSIVHTVLENAPDARRVRILIGGSPVETFAGHIAIDRPLIRFASLTSPAPRQAASESSRPADANRVE